MISVTRSYTGLADIIAVLYTCVEGSVINGTRSNISSRYGRNARVGDCRRPPPAVRRQPIIEVEFFNELGK